MSPFQHSLRPSTLRLTASGLALAVLSACTPMSEAEKEYLQKRQEERDAESQFQDNITHNAKINDLLKKVKEWKQEDGHTAEQYIRIQIDSAKGQVLTPAWTVTQKRQGGLSRDLPLHAGGRGVQPHPHRVPLGGG